MSSCSSGSPSQDQTERLGSSGCRWLWLSVMSSTKLLVAVTASPSVTVTPSRSPADVGRNRNSFTRYTFTNSKSNWKKKMSGIPTYSFVIAMRHFQTEFLPLWTIFSENIIYRRISSQTHFTLASIFRSQQFLLVYRPAYFTNLKFSFNTPANHDAQNR